MKIMQFVWFLVLSFFVTNVFGQDEQSPPSQSTFSSDRPSFTTGPTLMEPGVWQLEIGYTYRDEAAGGSHDVGSFPETMLRYGLDEKIELRIGWNGYDFVDDADDKAGDSSIGAKYHLGNGIWGTDSLALIGTLSIPTGSGESELDPTFLLGWEKALNDDTTLSGNIGIAFPSDETTGNRFTQGKFSLMYSMEFDADTSVFAEYYTNFPTMDDGDNEHMLQAGVLHIISPDTQLDFRFGVGLNDESDDWLVGVGISHRF